jgi:hypothetical protein
MREDGFYHVRYGDEWQVAEWLSALNSWIVTGSISEISESTWSEIDERRITRGESVSDGDERQILIDIIQGVTTSEGNLADAILSMGFRLQGSDAVE